MKSKLVFNLIGMVTMVKAIGCVLSRWVLKLPKQMELIKKVIILFPILHDSKQIFEDGDHKHGLRSANM